jgi:DNA-binding transcriptional LysR family regulator
MSSNRNVELHLLACLDALLQERQVTRAAERMNMSQPGMSNALARLRQKLQDPLLVRTAHGMVPTERALQLEASVRAALRHVDAAFAPQNTFDPGTARNTFKIAISDYVSQLFLPSLMGTILREAPGVRVVASASDARRLREGLEESGVSLCVGYYTEMPEDLYTTEVFTDTMCCIARRGHPVLKDSVSLEDYVRQPQILMVGGAHAATFEAVTDQTLQACGVTRNIVMWVPNLLTVPTLVASSDLIATIPCELARRSQQHMELQVLETPFQVPTYRLSMVWHELTQHDAAHRWLRQKLREIAQSFAPKVVRAHSKPLPAQVALHQP